MINNVNAGKYPEEACQGKKVVVVGGGSVGLDVIEYFAPRGAECHHRYAAADRYACRPDHQMLHA